MPRSRILVVLLFALGLVAGSALVLAPAQARSQLPAPIGQDPVVPGQPYTGDFPDPWILRIGPKYFAYSTTTGSSIKSGLNLPTMSSTNLRSWVLRPATPDAPLGDALPKPAAWAAYSSTQPDDGRLRPGTGPWAPSVTRLGRHRFVLAYAVQVAGAPGVQMCVSLAHATSPIGPFVDTTTAPTVCPPNGAIDPQVFVPPGGRRPWLVFKADHYPARLYTRPMDLDATRVLPNRPVRFLAKVRQPWEGSIIENPAMIYFKKRYYLFYSANSYASTRYAIGYLICKDWRGPCQRPRKKPLLHTAGRIAGPGGPAPFVDTHGRLRLGYHAWTVGAVGYPTSLDCQAQPAGCGQRRLYVARLGVKPDGRLRVLRYY
jgi:beta-xylosidase